MAPKCFCAILYMFVPSDAAVVGGRERVRGGGEATTSHLSDMSPELVSGVIFGIVMLFLGLIYLWQNRRRRHRVSGQILLSGSCSVQHGDQDQPARGKKALQGCGEPNLAVGVLSYCERVLQWVSISCQFFNLSEGFGVQHALSRRPRLECEFSGVHGILIPAPVAPGRTTPRVPPPCSGRRMAYWYWTRKVSVDLFLK